MLIVSKQSDTGYCVEYARGSQLLGNRAAFHLAPKLPTLGPKYQLTRILVPGQTCYLQTIQL